MTRKHLLALPLVLLCCSAAVQSQDRLEHLKSWDGQPSRRVDRSGKVTADFFAQPAIRGPLRRLLSGRDYERFNQAYAAGSPLKLVGDVLAAKSACFPPVGVCPGGAGFAINVKTGTLYVRIQDGTKEKWIVSGGKGLDLTREVQDYIGKPTRKQL